MRSVYPISSKENENELNELQEHMIRLIGLDSNVFDDDIERPGVYDTIDIEIDASGIAAVDDRLYSEDEPPLYSFIYRENLVYNIRRRTHG